MRSIAVLSEPFLAPRRAAGLLCVLLQVALYLLPMATAAANPDQVRTEFESQCRAQSPSTDFVNCACAARKIMELANAKGVPPNYGLIDLASQACPQNDKAAIARSMFRSCDSYHTALRTDHAAFCQCVGSDVADAFTAAPQSGPRYRDMLYRNALLKCNVADDSKRVKEMKKPVEPGGAAYDKVRSEQEANCRSNGMLSVWVNCACVGRKLGEDAATPGENRPISAAEAAYESCPQDDKAVIEKFVFESCDSAMVSVRTDHDAFCRCTGQKTAADFVAKPQFNGRYREQLRRTAMQTCGIADTSKRVKP